MNVKKLQQAWIDYHKTAFYEGLRFGQYVYNEHDYQTDMSYMQANNEAAYQVIFNSLIQRVEELS